MYHDEKIEATLRARIHPTDKRVPECVCRITLTSGHLYVSEDNFDGTFEDHYILDFVKIEDILISNPYAKSVTPEEEGPSLLGKNGFDSPIRGGLIFKLLEGKKEKLNYNGKTVGNPRAKYLEIIYTDDATGKREHLYFNDWATSPKAFIKRFKEVTGRIL